MILVLVADMPDETIFGILRAANTWLVVMIILPRGRRADLYRHGVQRVLIWIAFGWFVLGVGALLLGYRGEHL